MAPATRHTARRRMASARTRGVTLLPGSVRAEVRQESFNNQIVEIRVPAADAAVVEALLDTAASRGRWLAALAAGELPDDLAEVLLAAGLAPPAEGLTAQCSCRSLPGLCVHAGIAAAVAARVLGGDPGALLVLRGLRRERLRELVARRLPGGGRADGVLDPAAIDWDSLVLAPAAPLPEPPGLAGAAADPAYPPLPAGSGLEPGEAEGLAADAAARARELLAHGGSAALDLDADADLGRRAAGLGGARLADLARRGHSDPQELAALAQAWRVAGAGGVSALRRP